jgi:D-glycero-D-manno-heptose 1,7-bisphosphate phosphatase
MISLCKQFMNWMRQLTHRLLIAPLRQPAPALFLDRDGVVIEYCHHLSNSDQVRLSRGARHLIASPDRQGWLVMLITNQSGIAWGLFQWRHFEMVNERMQQLLGSDAPLAAIYYANGHGQDAAARTWRKPSPLVLCPRK